MNVTTTGISGSSLNEVVQRLRAQGFVYEPNLSTSTRVVVAATSESKKVEVARIRGIPCVSVAWTTLGRCEWDRVLEFSMPEVHPVQQKPKKQSVTVPKWVICTTALPRHLKEVVRLLCDRKNATYQSCLKRNCTHLVVPYGGVDAGNEKVLFAKDHDIRLMTFEEFVIEMNGDDILRSVLQKHAGGKAFETVNEMGTVGEIVCYCTPATSFTSEVAGLVSSIGARLAVEFTAEVSHVVMLKDGDPSLFRRPGVEVVTLEWIRARAKSRVPLQRAGAALGSVDVTGERHEQRVSATSAPRGELRPARSATLVSCPVITLTSLTSTEKREWKSAVEQTLGGLVQDELVLGAVPSPNNARLRNLVPTTHLVAPRSACARSEKVRALGRRYLANGSADCFLVSIEWISTCIAQGRWVDCQPFCIPFYEVIEAARSGVEREGCLRPTGESTPVAVAARSDQPCSRLTWVPPGEEKGRIASTGPSSKVPVSARDQNASLPDTLTVPVADVEEREGEGPPPCVRGVAFDASEVGVAPCHGNKREVTFRSVSLRSAREESVEASRPTLPGRGKLPSPQAAAIATNATRVEPRGVLSGHVDTCIGRESSWRSDSSPEECETQGSSVSLEAFVGILEERVRATTLTTSAPRIAPASRLSHQFSVDHMGKAESVDAVPICQKRPEVDHGRDAENSTSVVFNLSSTSSTLLVKEPALRKRAPLESQVVVYRRDASDVDGAGEEDPGEQNSDGADGGVPRRKVKRESCSGLRAILVSKSLLQDERVVPQIIAMGGCVTSDYLECTHYITPKPSKTETFLCCVAAGKWVLAPTFLTESARRGEFAREVDHEWCPERVGESGEVLRGSVVTLMQACRLQRCRQQRPFATWKVVLCCDTIARAESFARVLQSGGCESVSAVDSPQTLLTEGRELLRTHTHVLSDDAMWSKVQLEDALGEGGEAASRARVEGICDAAPSGSPADGAMAADVVDAVREQVGSKRARAVRQGAGAVVYRMEFLVHCLCVEEPQPEAYELLPWLQQRRR